jgi:hypothetical protein
MKRFMLAGLVLLLWIGAYRFSRGEPLTTDEKAYLRSLHIGGDVDRVRVHRNTWLADHISPGIRWGTVLQAIPYHIFTISADQYGSNYLPDLAHEYTHIVTVEKGFPVATGKYAYGGPEALRAKHFWEFNSEQQATIVEDYARLKDSGLNTSAYRPRLDELAGVPDGRVATLSGTETLVLMAARMYLVSHDAENGSIVALAGR